MPEVQYTTTMHIPREAIWDFVKDMNNWAPFVTGYQKHEVIDERDSVWTLKGDVGILSRRVDLQAHITEWAGPDRVSFTLTGLNEKVEGGGEFTMSTHNSDERLSVEAPRLGLLQRALRWLFRGLYRRIHGPAAVRALAAGGEGAVSVLQFTLRMDAGGPTAPLVNAMLGPAMLPAAEDLANKIAAHLEAGARAGHAKAS